MLSPGVMRSPWREGGTDAASEMKDRDSDFFGKK
jgi:hypothetical protein